MLAGAEHLVMLYETPQARQASERTSVPVAQHSD